jgi:hypothetical protein
LLSRRTGTAIIGHRIGRGVGLGRRGSLLDPRECDNMVGQQAQNDTDSTREGTLPPTPTAGVSHTDPEQPREMPLRETKPGERCAEFGRNWGNVHVASFYTADTTMC